MGASQHPSTELRSNYAIGNLAPGAALAIAAHIDLCRACRLALARMDTHANTDFDITTPARRSPRPAAPIPSAARPPLDAGAEPSLPASLKGVAVGAWRRSGPGVRTGPLEGAAGLGESVHMLIARRGAFLPSGRPGFLLVLGGLLHAGATTYQAGDFLELTGPDDPRFRAGATGCRCLVVGDDALYRRPLWDWLRRLSGR
jgi:anti-sigma factor ChrR (cupin superfamily)